MAILWIVGIAAVIAYALYRRAISSYLVVDKIFPGPTPLPLLGNALELLEESGAFYKKIFNYIHYYKDSFRIWVGPIPYVALIQPEEAEAVLGSNSQITKSTEYSFLTPWIGLGLLTSTGSKWKAHRKILTPAFHFKILESFVDVFNANGDILCNKLAQKVDHTFDVYEDIKLYALDNICESAMGTSVNAQTKQDSQYVEAIDDVCVTVFARSTTVWLRPDLLFNLSPTGARQRRALKIIHGTTNEVIRKRKTFFNNNKNVPSISLEDKELNVKQRLAFLDVLLLSQNKSQMTDDDIRAEVDTFMFEGHDTITSGLSFLLFLLAENPKVQEKVFKEQFAMFGNDPRSPSYRELQEMKYLEQVIKESLRLYPSVPFIGRKITEDLPIREGAYLPKDTQAFVIISALNRNPRCWDNPDEFNPDNFSPENLQGKHPYASTPFSAGPRNCIGQRFAMLEMKSAISKIIRRFELMESPLPEDKPRITADLILKSENGIKIKINTREKI